jgi:dynein heavy chain
MAVVHQKTVGMCSEYLAIEKRFNYATPKSYLEYIDLYCSLLSTKQTEMQVNFDALERGLQKLEQTEEDVGQLKLRIEEEAKFVAEKSVS